jgi:hypothetical protein
VQQQTFSLDPFPVRGPVHWEAVNQEMRDLYTLNGQIPVHIREYFLDSEGIPAVVSYPPSVQPVWSKALLEDLLNKAGKRSTEGMTGYGGSAPRDMYAAIDAFPVKDKSVLVIGTLNPWIEAIVLAYGNAKEVYTVDFNKPISELSQFKTLSIPELEQLGRRFDVVVSFSAIEHDGLGRYGDPLNPNADLQRMKKIKNFIKRDGIFFFSVPVGKDTLYFNAHRVYGKIRWPLLTEGWSVIDYFEKTGYSKDYFDSADWIQQPIHVLKPIW